MKEAREKIDGRIYATQSLERTRKQPKITENV